MRVGRYRVICEIDDKDKRVVILDIGHRKDVYLRKENLNYVRAGAHWQT